MAKGVITIATMMASNNFGGDVPAHDLSREKYMKNSDAEPR
jgi:hypothetical protein